MIAGVVGAVVVGFGIGRVTLPTSWLHSENLSVVQTTAELGECVPGEAAAAAPPKQKGKTITIQ
jgi:hypothetical protein